MNNTIDLHGKSHEEALIIVEDYILVNSFDNLLDLELITGNSTTLQNKIINKILKKHEFSYYIPNHNRGVMYITDSKIN